MAIVKELLKDLDAGEEIEKLIIAEIKGEEKEIEVPEGEEDPEAFKQAYEDELRKKLLEKRESYFRTKLTPEFDQKVKDQVEVKAKELYPATMNPLVQEAAKSGFLTSERVKELQEEGNFKGIIVESLQSARKTVDEGAAEGDTDKAEILKSLNDFKSENVDLKSAMEKLKTTHAAELAEKDQEKDAGISDYKRDILFGKEVAALLPEMKLSSEDALELIPGALKKHNMKYKVSEDGKSLILTDLKGANALSIDGKRELGSFADGVREVMEVRNWKKVAHTRDEFEEDGVTKKKKLTNKSKATERFFGKKK